MVENDRKNIYNLTTPDSFSQLDDAISGFDAYIQCMEIMHDFYGKMKDKIRSEGVKSYLRSLRSITVTSIIYP